MQELYTWKQLYRMLAPSVPYYLLQTGFVRALYLTACPEQGYLRAEY